MSEALLQPVHLLGQDGFHVWLEDLYLVGREQMESAILAHLLRHEAYRAAFLRNCHISWPAGTHAVVRCEFPIVGGGRADILLEWKHAGTRRVFIEHKPWAPFTPGQPANYIRQLKQDDATHAAFVLIASGTDRKDEARRRILRSRVVPATAGSSWSSIEGELRGGHRSRAMKFSLLSRLVRSLAAVDGPALHRGLAEFLRSRHDVEEEEISEPAQARVSALHARLRITDDEPTVGPESCGFYLRYEGEGRHGERLWLGVRPPVARRLGVADETMLLLLGGHLPGKEHGILETWRQTYGLRCTSVHSGQELPESAIPITEESAEKALDDLIRALKIPRARGRK